MPKKAGERSGNKASGRSKANGRNGRLVSVKRREQHKEKTAALPGETPPKTPEKPGKRGPNLLWFLKRNARD